MRIILVGFGVVGQSLARILLQRRPELVKSYGFNPKVVAVVDKGGAAVNMRGLDLGEILSLKVKEGTVAAGRDGRPDLSALEVIESVEAEVMVCLLYTSPSPRDRG